VIFEPDTIDAFGVRKDGGADLLIVPWAAEYHAAFCVQIKP
jgi:hypothetical protein